MNALGKVLVAVTVVAGGAIQGRAAMADRVAVPSQRNAHRALALHRDRVGVARPLVMPSPEATKAGFPAAATPNYVHPGLRRVGSPIPCVRASI